jgi:hypothetical protein
MTHVTYVQSRKPNVRMNKTQSAGNNFAMCIGKGCFRTKLFTRIMYWETFGQAQFMDYGVQDFDEDSCG